MDVSHMIPTLSDALAERGFDALTEVQTAVTAPELAAADLLVSAQTGSGKTVGFGLAIAPTLMGEETRLDRPGAPLALVVAPTRELALQVQRELAWLYAKAGARVVSCIGGMDARDERRTLDRGAHIVVGTPGRLRDHITRGNLALADLRAIVLDEADEMLDLGFREDLEFMLDAAPAERRTLLFSATVPPAIAELAKAYQRDAVRVTTLSRGSQHADIAYQVVQVAASDAEHAIINLLRFHDAPRSIVFANTRAAVAHLAARLTNRGLSVVSLSGELSQDERSHALQAMRDGRARVCVATDVAARGIDLPNLDLVIHADLPTSTEALLHRSGRTGRAGRKGISALIVSGQATKKAARLLKWAKVEAEWTFPPTPEEILALDETRLLADPVWAPDLSEAEGAFVARLMADQSPERIAAACLRLYRARLSAPEEVNAPPARAPRAEPVPFGPSAWIELSVGEDKRAEARWLLPLLCRAGQLEKSQIGKIRVLPETTVVELAAPAVPGFFARLGPEGTLEEGIHARKLDGPPKDVPVARTRQDRPPPARTSDLAAKPPRKPRHRNADRDAEPVLKERADAAAERLPHPEKRDRQKPKGQDPARDASGKLRAEGKKPAWAKPKQKQRHAGAAGKAAKSAGHSRPETGASAKGRARTSGKPHRAGPGGPRPKGGNAPPRRKG